MKQLEKRKAVMLMLVAVSALAVISLTAAIASPSCSSFAGYLAGTFLCLAYLSGLLLVWIDGKPIQTMGGQSLSKEQNPASYRLSLLLMSVLGWIGLIVFISNLLSRSATTCALTLLLSS